MKPSEQKALINKTMALEDNEFLEAMKTSEIPDLEVLVKCEPVIRRIERLLQIRRKARNEQN